MASPNVPEQHMPPAAYIELTAADVTRERANARAAAAAYLAADAHMAAAAEAEERFLAAASELRYALHVHERYAKQARARLYTRDPTKCESCQQELSQEDLDANWGRCAQCL